MQVRSGRARNGDVELAWERMGPATGEPLLLVMGFGVQRHFWPDGFCQELVRRGFDVVRYDNRDVGESTHLHHLRPPTMTAMLTRPRTTAPYRLSQMADDAVAVLDAQRWRRAHVMGVSMGGMIAQTLALRHQDRVRSLTSVSSTPSPRVGRPTLSARRLFLQLPATTAEQYGDRLVRQFQIIGSPEQPVEEVWLRAYARSAFERGHDPAGMRRQLAAVMASGSRVRALGRLRVPTLVVHGTADPLIRPIAGRATAAAVHGARLALYEGMGHDLPPAFWPRLSGDVAALAATAARTG